MMRAQLLLLVCLGALLCAPLPAAAVYQCGNQKDTCQCGANNPYPCCDNGSNCTWWAWEAACCNWGIGLPGWGNANTWGQYASQNGNYQVLSSPVPGSVATSTKGGYGHVAYVTSVDGALIHVTEMNCCPTCNYGMRTATYYWSYFNSGFVIPKSATPPGPVCGSGGCQSGENCANCPADCGSCCGNGSCDNGENCASCSKDCGSCCGNGKCDNGENCSSCSGDCGVCCGNGACDFGETCDSCSGDCGICCGNGKCDFGETCDSCSGDCGECCGNGQCDYGENCQFCSQDCGECCGNGLCDFGETCDTCDKDCGKCCGDGDCNYGETCDSCSKDCGICCGNGLCDFGETCGSCASDCICLPTGGIELAQCSQVSGWALDTDATKKVTVQLRVGGEVAATFKADGPLHAGHGFSWAVPENLKQGKPIVLTVDALDGESAGVTTFGPRTFLCDNATTHEGIWTTTRKDEAGLEVSLPAPAGPALLSLRHRHGLGVGYPIDGVMETCTRPGLEAFDAATAQAQWALTGTPLRSRLLLDGQVLRDWQGGEGSEAGLKLGAGEQICLHTEALMSSIVSEQASVDLSQLTLQTGAWQYSYSAQASGLILSRPLDDTLRIRARLGEVAPVIGRGQLRVWHDFGAPFDAVAFALGSTNAAMGVSELTAGKTLWQAQPGAQVRHGLAAQSLEWRVRVPTDAELPVDFGYELAQIRVMRSDVAAAGPWQLARQDAWGFEAQLPTDADVAARGLAVDLRHVPPGWWSVGQATASAGVSGVPFERVRATLQNLAAGPGVRLRVLADNQNVLTSMDVADLGPSFDLTAQGHVLTLAIGADLDQQNLPAAALAVRQLEFLRKGWWTAPTPQCVGLRDDRVGEDGVRLEHAQLWGQLGFAALGADVVHRAFPAAQLGVRFHYRQDLDPKAVQVSVQFGGKDTKILGETGAVEKQVEVLGSFQDLAFAITATDGLAHDALWFAEFSHIEVLGSDDLWHAAVERVTPVDPSGPDAGSADAGADVAGLADAPAPGGPGTVGTTSTSAPSPSCAASRGPGQGAASLGGLILALAALALRRRRSPRF